MSALVTVIPNAKHPAAAVGGAVVGPLRGALPREWNCDAHMQCGYAVDGRRIARASLALGPVVMTAIAFDFDPPGHAEDAAWSATTRAQLEALIAARGGFAHSTRVGWRYIAELATPFHVVGDDGWKAWRSSYNAACEALERDYGLVADRSCDTPGSLFRLPRAVRDGVRLEPVMIGDVEKLGGFELPATIATPRSPTLVATAPFEPKQVIVEVQATEELPPERYLTFRRLREAGAIAQRHPTNPRAFWIRCPNAAKHQNGSDGCDGSTALFLPETGASGYGIVKCLHSACASEDLTALVIEGPVTRRDVQIAGVGSEVDVNGVTIVLRLEAADDGGALPLRYLRIGSGYDGRWLALWEAADVSDPEDLDAERGDLSGALQELRGRVITVEIGEDATVRRLLAPKERAA